MLADIKLLLPALTPSWRFFDSVGPSPRIEYAAMKTAHEPPTWREHRPRPAFLSAREMFWRLFWNPERNESLFLTSCAERLLEAPSRHSSDEIRTRVAADLPRGAASFLQFRIVTVRRCEAQLIREVAYVSRVEPV